MKNSFRKLIPIAAAIGLSFAVSSAYAFTLADGNGTTYATNATTLDWNTDGSGVAIGVGPFAGGTALTAGTQFQFLYQANLVSVNGNTTSAFRGNLDANSNGVPNDSNAFEFTIVAKLNEYVLNSNVDATTGLAHANFALQDTPTQNKVAIYYDTAANANTGTGTGFDDGTLIALLTIVPTSSLSQFEATSLSTGQGSTQLHAVIDASQGDFINTAYLDGVTSLGLDVQFDSNLNYPPGSSATTGFQLGGDETIFPGYNVNPASDIVFKVDGSSTFTNGTVPEPGSTMLLGLGMLGLVGATRRKAKKG
jgi:hypothetical protein